MTPKHHHHDPREVCVEVATVPQNPERSLASQRWRCWNPVKSTAGRKFRQIKLGGPSSSSLIAERSIVIFTTNSDGHCPSSFPRKIPWNRTRASVKLQALVQNFRQVDERRQIPSVQLPFPLLFPLNAMVPEDRGSEEKRRTPKNSVNSTTVPALVPAQYDGSGGPWQWGEAVKFFVKSTNVQL